MSTEGETDDPRVEGEPPLRADVVSPRAHAAFWFAIGCAVLAVVQLPLALAGSHVVAPHDDGSSALGAPSNETPADNASAMTAADAAPSTVDGAPMQQLSLVDPDAPPASFRVAQLSSDETLDVVEATVGKRTCDGALLSMGVTRRDILRVEQAMSKLRKLAGCRAHDRFVVAMTKEGKRLRALELETAPGDFIVVHERSLDVPAQPDADAAVGNAASEAGASGDGDLIAAHFTLPVSHRRHAVAFVVQTDLPAAVASSGLDPSILEPLDEALSSRNDLPPISRGSIFRVVADATYVQGRFDRYDELVAVELRARPEAPPIRLYHLRDPKDEHPKNASSAAWFDAKAHQPMHGRFRMPLAFARVTSRFNPRRLHPILHTVMPHNGCDFAASPGTPVYSIAAGVVAFEGNAGASGNLVTILHEGGLESGYAHLSRFAAGVSAGTRVEAHALIGYSGSTGRSTGPHLHLSVKKNGAFIDPLTLKLDAVRVVPTSERNVFTVRKAEADAALDAIPLPKLDLTPTPASPSGSASQTVDDEPSDDDQK